MATQTRNSQSSPKKASSLEEVLRFTPQDLSANQQGQLSERQRAYLRTDRRKNAILGAALLILFILAATAFLYIGSQQANRILQGLGVVLALCNMGVSWFFGLSVIRMTYDLSTNRADILDGQAQHVVRQFGRAQAGSVRIGDTVEIPTDVEGFKVFKPRATYRLYRTSHSQRLLSAELLDERR